MTTEKWLLVGTDPRIKKTALLLNSPHREIQFVETASWTAELETLCRSMQPDCIVFPIQPLVLQKEIDLSVIPEKTVLFFGRVTEQWKRAAECFTTYFYLQDEQFIWQNAKLTAEGWVAAFYEKERKSIDGKTFHVTGFGRVAKMLASILKSMGANVFIFVRSEANVCEAKAYGYDAAYLTPQKFGKERISWLLNTIPAQWFTEEFERFSGNEMIVYDLSSAPGCLYEVDLQDRYELMPGIPGKYFADEAAMLLTDTIIQLYNIEKEQSNA